MQSLINFLLNNKHWFLFLLFEVISLFVLFSHDGYQRNVYLTTANGFVGSIYSTVSSVTSYLNLQTVNNELESENEQLRREVLTLRKKLRLSHTDTLKIKGLETDYTFISAQIVNATLHRSNNLFTINKGEADGIRPEMGVVCSRGVVGVVYLTSAHYSVVMPLINVNSRISCRLKGSDYFGTLEWKQGRSDITRMIGVPLHAKFKEKAIVETNGYSDIFPPGIPIGYVMSKETTADGMSYLLKVGLSAKFNTLREVSIITNYTQPERHILEEQAGMGQSD